MIKAIIFDLDGVLVDTAKFHYLAWKNLAMMMGFEFSEADNERLKGVSRMASLEILIDIGQLSFDEATKQELARFKNEEYVGYISQMTPEEILPGVKGFLYEIRQAGIKMAIGSASKNTPLILERIGLATSFDVVVDGNKVSAAKPDPEVFLKAAELMGVSPSDCVVFEDAEAGIEAAVRGGMHCIGIGSAQTLAKADAVIAGFEGYSLAILNNQIKT